MKIKINKQVEISGLSRDEMHTAMKHLQVPNPVYNVKLSQGLSIWGVEQTYRYYSVDRSSSNLLCPVGALPQLVELLLEKTQSKILPQDFIDERVTPAASKVKRLKFSATLRDYQQEIVDTLLSKTVGVVQADTGSGKTICFVALTAARKVNTCILVNTKELAQQTVDRFVEFLNIKPEHIGFIGDGRFEPKPITVALHQTLSRLDNTKWAQIEKFFGQVIFDECHLIAANTFYENASKFYAKYKHGFTATPRRSDGLEQVIYFATGPIVYKTTSEQVDGNLIRPTLKQVDTNYNYLLFDTKDYTFMLNDLCLDETRNAQILLEVERYKDKPQVILCGRVEQIEWFKEKLGDRAVMLHSQMKPKARKLAMQQLINGEKDIVVSSWGLFSTGIDVARLAVMHLASPMKSEIKIRQACGRIMRPAPGKTESLVIDYVDPEQWLLERQAKTRLKHLKAVRDGKN